MNENARLFFELVSAFGKSQVLRVAAALGIADHIANDSRTSAELATLTATDPTALRRLLSALAAIGIAAETEPGRFALTELGRECLVSDSPTSLKAVAEYFGHPVCWDTWLDLLYSIKTGQPAFPHVFGTTAWEYRARHPDVTELFCAAMRSFARGQQASITGHYEFGSAHTIVDVGGGNGTLLAAILAAHPQVRGVLFDLPAVVAAAPPVLAAAGVADRCEIVGGDFFSHVPAGGDLYVLRAIIHNWDDAAATRILARCRDAIGPGSRLLVVELLRRQSETTGRFWHHFLDLHMLVTLGGGERTAEQLGALYSAAGFELTRIVHTPGDDLIEGVPR